MSVSEDSSSDARGSAELFKFSCPHCQQHISSEDDVSGCEVECPECGERFVVQQTNPSAPSTEKKRSAVSNLYSATTSSGAGILLISVFLFGWLPAILFGPDTVLQGVASIVAVLILAVASLFLSLLGITRFLRVNLYKGSLKLPFQKLIFTGSVGVILLIIFQHIAGWALEKDTPVGPRFFMWGWVLKSIGWAYSSLFLQDSFICRSL